jgi:hypothetical protein
MVLSQKDYKFHLQFLDLQSFRAGGTLDEKVKAFTGVQSKGVFPYELLTTENLMEELNKTESLELRDFKSDLTNSTLAEERHQEYLKEQKKFSNKLACLLHCNKTI